MSFWDTVKKYSPEIIGGVTGGALLGPVGALAGVGVGAAGQYVAGKVNDAYDQKKTGLMAVKDAAAGMEQQRLQRLQDVYGQADSKFDNSRAAMKSVYGDPKSWKI